MSMPKLESKISSPKYNLVKKFENEKIKNLAKEHELLINNLLHLDPHNDVGDYHKQYNEKHNPKIPLYK